VLTCLGSVGLISLGKRFKLVFIQSSNDLSYPTDSFTLDISYQRGAISAAEVDVNLDHFEVALNFIAREPQASVWDIECITANEKQRLLYRRNPPHPLGALLNPIQNISELIESQVERSPQRIVVSAPQKLTTGIEVAICSYNSIMTSS
jgi:hypothetical protein